MGTWVVINAGWYKVGLIASVDWCDFFDAIRKIVCSDDENRLAIARPTATFSRFAIPTNPVANKRFTSLMISNANDQVGFSDLTICYRKSFVLEN